MGRGCQENGSKIDPTRVVKLLLSFIRSLTALTIIFQCFKQPILGAHHSTIAGFYHIGFFADKALGGCQSDKILRCFYFIFEVSVFSLDMRHRLLGRMVSSVADKCAVGIFDKIQKILDRTG